MGASEHDVFNFCPVRSGDCNSRTGRGRGFFLVDDSNDARVHVLYLHFLADRRAIPNNSSTEAIHMYGLEVRDMCNRPKLHDAEAWFLLHV